MPKCPNYSFKESFENVIFLFYRLFKGAFLRDFSTIGRLMISLSPKVNSINDYTGFHCRRFSFERYGYWGYCPIAYGGIHFGAMYAFLSNYLTWKLGLSGYTLYSIVIYLLLFISFSLVSSMPNSWIIMITGLFTLYSPYYKNSVFVCSRHDVPGWALLILSFWFMTSGSLIIPLICLTLAFMTHPSISIVGAFYILGFTATGLISPIYLLVFLTAQVFNVFWYIPFLKLFWKRMIVLHSWSKNSYDKTRSMGIHLRKAFGMSIFLICLASTRPGMHAYIFALVPFAIFMLCIRKEQFVNRFSMELLWLCGAGAAYASTTAYWLFLPYLFSLYFYASPSPRFHFPFKPFLIDEKEFFGSFSPIVKKLPANARIGLFFMPNTMEQFRLDAKYIFLLSIWLHHKSTSVEHFTILPSFTENEVINDSKLLDFSQKHGISYLLTTSSYSDLLDESKALQQVVSCTHFPTGSVPGTRFSLYQYLDGSHKIVPEGEVVSHETNGLIVKCRPGLHEIKYRPVPGLRVFQDHTELEIENKQEYSFRITSLNDSKIRIVFYLKKLWVDLIWEAWAKKSLFLELINSITSNKYGKK